MQKKTFDPRCSKVTNPFVQAYLEQQVHKAKPIGDKQKVVNIVLIMALLMNTAGIGILVCTSRTSIVPQLSGSDTANETMGDAVSRIKQLEITLQNMKTSVEYHKNAYLKLEQEHETLKAALTRVVPADNPRETLSNYPNQPTSQVDAFQTDDTVKAAREAAVAAQLALPSNGQ